MCGIGLQLPTPPFISFLVADVSWRHAALVNCHRVDGIAWLCDMICHNQRQSVGIRRQLESTSSAVAKYYYNDDEDVAMGL
jgi:hypothetical protein